MVIEVCIILRGFFTSAQSNTYQGKIATRLPIFFSYAQGKYLGKTTTIFDGSLLLDLGLTRFKNIRRMNIIRKRIRGESCGEYTDNSRRLMLYVIRAKACKRCGGDLSLECDIYGIYIQCIQCGATWNKQDLALYNARDIENSLKVIQTKPRVTTGRRR